MRTYNVLFLFSLILGASSTYVAFRMDDIQDYWLTNAQAAVIDIFQKTNTPLSFGIIGNEFGTGDDAWVAKVRKYITDAKASGWDLEVCNHGYNHEYFTNYNLAKQQQLMQDAVKYTIANLTGAISEITTFIPPYNAFDLNTVTAAKNAGFNVMSADPSSYNDASVMNNRKYPGTDPNFRELPVGAATTDPADTVRISSDSTMEYIRTQISQAGFSAVMMHFVEFVPNMNPDGTTLNQTSLDDLEALIQKVKAAGYTPVTLRTLRTMMNGGSSTPVPAPAATTGKAAAVPSTTGKPVATPSTTGKAAAVPSTTSKPVAAPSTTGKPVATPSTTGKAVVAPATTGMAASVPSTTSKPVAVPSTTGKAVVAPATTGKPVAVPSTTGMASASSSSGSSSGYTSIDHCDDSNNYAVKCELADGQGPNYKQCVNGQLYTRPCAAGTVCYNADNGFSCGFPQ